jgi:DNA polymerase III epsilon subunit-like protein
MLSPDPHLPCPSAREVCDARHASMKRERLSLFAPAPADEAGAAPPRARPAPRRYLVELFGDEPERASLEAELAARAGVRSLDGSKALPWTELSFLSLDTETTGLDPKGDRITELGWVRFERGREVSRHASLCRVDAPLPAAVREITGIDDAMLAGAAPFASCVDALFAALAAVDFVVAYNAAFDAGFLRAELARLGRELPGLPWVDPLVFVRELDRFERGKRLEDAARRWGVPLEGSHRALADATASGELLIKMAPFLRPRTLDELLAQQQRLSRRS